MRTPPVSEIISLDSIKSLKEQTRDSIENSFPRESNRHKSRSITRRRSRSCDKYRSNSRENYRRSSKSDRYDRDYRSSYYKNSKDISTNDYGKFGSEIKDNSLLSKRRHDYLESGILKKK